MILYKYLSPDRIDVIQNLKIRFTQPLYLNDPYESNPNITGTEMTNEQWDKIAEIEAERNGLNLEQFAHLKTKENRDIAFPDALQLMKVFFHHTIGVLSLSETFDNPLMWAHYCKNHSGFVIGLKTDNSFFYSSKKPFTVDNLSKVIYSESRPNITIENLKMEHMYFTKSDYWSYEREWRLLKKTEAADLSLNGGEVCLYNISSDIIESVYIGANCSKELEEKIVASVRACKGRIQVFKMVLNESNFDIDYIRYESWLDLKKDIMDNRSILFAMEDIRQYLHSKNK